MSQCVFASARLRPAQSEAGVPRASLTSLDLRGNILGPADIAAMAHVFRINSTIREVTKSSRGCSY